MANFRGGNRFGGGRKGFNDRGRRGPVEMHQAICDKCRNSCEVPFRPTGGKPVYCNNCFGEKRGAGDRNREPAQSQLTEQFEALNNKLDRILALLTPNAVDKPEK